jgi:hypothetical protein
MFRKAQILKIFSYLKKITLTYGSASRTDRLGNSSVRI